MCNTDYKIGFIFGRKRTGAIIIIILNFIVFPLFASSQSNLFFFDKCIGLPAFENCAPFAVEASFADYLFSQSFFRDAADEYDRIAKQHPLESAYDYAAYQCALCMIHTNNLHDAENILDRLAYTALDEDVSYRARLLRALVEVAQDTPERAEFLLSDLLRDVPKKNDEIRYWRGWFRLLLSDMDGALEDFGAVCDATTRNSYYAPRAYGVKRWLDMNRDCIEQRSQYLARWLSGILPGAGQMYMGNWCAGMNALILNGVFGYLTIDAIMARRYVQSMTIFLVGWNRYYFGGMINAEREGIKFNKKQLDKTIETLMNTFIDDEETNDLSESVNVMLPQSRWLNGFSITANGLLQLYQKHITTQDAQMCQFHPGCSDFSRIAFGRHNPFLAIVMTSDRLQRCNPFARKHYPKDSEGFLIDTEWGCSNSGNK